MTLNGGTSPAFLAFLASVTSSLNFKFGSKGNKILSRAFFAFILSRRIRVVPNAPCFFGRFSNSINISTASLIFWLTISPSILPPCRFNRSEASLPSFVLLDACFTINVIATSLGTGGILLLSFVNLSGKLFKLTSLAKLVPISTEFSLKFLNILTPSTSVNSAVNLPLLSSFAGTLRTKFPSSLNFIAFLKSAISASVKPSVILALLRTASRVFEFWIFDASLNFPAIAASSPILNALVD